MASLLGRRVLIGAVMIGTFVLSAGLARWLVWAPSALRVLDHPNERSLHHAPTPRTGGLAILISLFAGAGAALVCVRVGWMTGDPALVVSNLTSAENGIAAAGVLAVAIVSFIDDRWGVRPLVRFGVQLAAATLVVGTAASFDVFTVPLIGVVPFGALSIPIAILTIVWFANLFNFMDGMDGLAAGMAVIGFAFLCAIALNHGNLELAILSGLVAAAACGFLASNLPPALLFMGDVGSVPLGFLVGMAVLRLPREGVADVWVPLIVFSPFLVDSTAVLVRRLSRGARVWEAHREHAYQRLVLAGWSRRRTLLAEYGLMIASGLAAVLYLRVPSEPVRLMILVVVGIAYLALWRGVRRVECRT